MFHVTLKQVQDAGEWGKKQQSKSYMHSYSGIISAISNNNAYFIYLSITILFVKMTFTVKYINGTEKVHLAQDMTT